MTENPALLTRSGLGFYSVLLAVSLILSKLAEQMDRWYTAAGPDLEAQLAVGVGVGALGVWLSRLAERRIEALAKVRDRYVGHRPQRLGNRLRNG